MRKSYPMPPEQDYWLLAYLPGSGEARLYRFDSYGEPVAWKIASLNWEGLTCRLPNWLADEMEARYSAYSWGLKNGQTFNRVNVYDG